MIDKLLRMIQRALASSERDRLNDKFDAFDRRLDRLELDTAEIKTRLDSFHKVNLANQELFEEKLNSAKSGQEVLKEMIAFRFSTIENLIKSKL
jgi:hypothetical protein